MERSSGKGHNGGCETLFGVATSIEVDEAIVAAVGHECPFRQGVGECPLVRLGAVAEPALR